MRDSFRIKATELIARMTADGRAPMVGGSSEETWRSLRRAAHALKGAAHVVREKSMAAAAHNLEDALQAEEIAASSRGVDRLAQMLDAVFAAEGGSRR